MRVVGLYVSQTFAEIAYLEDGATVPMTVEVSRAALAHFSPRSQASLPACLSASTGFLMPAQELRGIVGSFRTHVRIALADPRLIFAKSLILFGGR